MSGLVAALCLAALLTIESIRFGHTLLLSVFALAARDPVPISPDTALRVAVLTTIVPAAEPLDMVAETLRAMSQITYGGARPDVWILDEGNDAEVRATAASLGVRHFSRREVPAFNSASGRFRRRTKAGNHNAWFTCHGDSYDVVAQLDPDHVPSHQFLERTLGYFRDPDVGFVVAPQVYGNAADNLVAHGASAQAFMFHGVIQRGANALGAPLLIGTNHVYRVETWRQIDGYQDSVIEDHLTSMTVHATSNLRTGHRWKGIYTPDVLAIGQAPSTWGSLFTQQYRWAQGAAEVALRHSGRLFTGMRPAQRVVYGLLQSYYPSAAVSWVLGTFVTVAMLLSPEPFGPIDTHLWPLLWAASVFSSLELFLWLRRMNLAEHEQSDSGVHGMVTTLCSAPIYLAATINALLRRPLAYRVTPKGRGCGTNIRQACVWHLMWFVLVAVALGGSLVTVEPVRVVSVLWAVGLMVICALPPVLELRSARWMPLRTGLLGGSGCRRSSGSGGPGSV